MNKPELQTRSYYDYTDCVNFINEKYDIGDTDFWSEICDYQHNGSSFTMDDTFLEELKEDDKIEAYEFAKALVDEFGQDAEYWIEW